MEVVFFERRAQGSLCRMERMFSLFSPLFDGQAPVTHIVFISREARRSPPCGSDAPLEAKREHPIHLLIFIGATAARGKAISSK